MGIRFTTKVTKNGNLKLDDLTQNILNLKHGDEVIVKIKKKTSGGFGDDFLHIPDFMLKEAGIDDSNGLISYVDGNSIVIIEADEDDDYDEYDDEEWDGDEDYE